MHAVHQIAAVSLTPLATFYVPTSCIESDMEYLVTFSCRKYVKQRVDPSHFVFSATTARVQLLLRTRALQYFIVAYCVCSKDIWSKYVLQECT
jgi:hypothetical protein